MDVARRPADRLDQRGAAAEEALLVGVEDRDERDLGQVEALAEEVDADELRFEYAAKLRDEVKELRRELQALEQTLSPS